MKQILKRIFGNKPKSIESSQSRPKTVKSAKELATERDEPYISVVSVDLDPDNIGTGSFELDWNDKFIANLVRAGFQKQPNESDHIIVDRWFQTVCRNVVLEYFEQEEADPDLRRISKRNLGDGRSEIS